MLFAVLGTVTALFVVLHRYPVVWLFDPRGDFSVFYGAAQAALHGREVYAVHNYYYLPAFTLLLRPLGLMGQGQAYVVWMLFLLCCEIGAVALLARQFGGRVIVGALALSPALLLAVTVSQPVAILTLALAGVMVALERERLLLAGVLLSAAWLKPQIALPAACFFVLWRPRAAIGFAAASAVLLLHPWLHQWLHKMQSFKVEQEQVQASLADLWPGVLGPHHAGFLIIVAAAGVASVLIWRRRWPPAYALAALLLIWFTAAPYNHAYDVTLLLVPLAVLAACPSIVFVDCLLGTLLSFYSLTFVVVLAPLLFIVTLARPGTPISRIQPLSSWDSALIPGHCSA